MKYSAEISAKNSRPIKQATLLLISCMTLLGWAAAYAQNWYPVKWVADGDTILLKDGRHIRLIGINAPEVAHEDSPAEPFGNAAKSTLSKLVDRSKVRLEWDEIRTDRYGRKLAHVYDCNNRLVSQIMVAKGLAHVLFQKKNQRHFKELLQSQQNAMAQKSGFWRTFKFDKKYEYYIGNKRSMRFHAPDCSEAEKIGRRNRLHLSDAWGAFEKGYAPAKGCLRGIVTFIK